MAILKVQADAENVLVEFDGVIAIHRVDNYRRGGACHVIAATISVIAGRIRQIDKQIFSFDRPVLGHGYFNSAAHRPAEYRTTLIRQAGQGRFYIGAGAAGGSVDQNAVPRIAEARTERSQPIARGLAAQSGGGRSRSGGKKNAGAKRTAATAADTLPIKIAFDAEHPCAPLAAHADCRADQTAADVEVPG